jgi:hypothetical protein
VLIFPLEIIQCQCETIIVDSYTPGHRPVETKFHEISWNISSTMTLSDYKVNNFMKLWRNVFSLKKFSWNISWNISWTSFIRKIHKKYLIKFHDFTEWFLPARGRHILTPANHLLVLGQIKKNGHWPLRDSKEQPFSHHCPDTNMKAGKSNREWKKNKRHHNLRIARIKLVSVSWEIRKNYEGSLGTLPYIGHC